MLQWIVAAAATPLDEAMADGRPVIVLVDRADHAPFGVWLYHATGAARERVDAVALVLATPDELAAWLGAPVPETADLVRLDPARQVAGHAAVHQPESERGPGGDEGISDADSPWQPLRPDALPPRGDPTAPHQPATRASPPASPPTLPSTARPPLRQYLAGVVRSHDAALASLLRRLPLAPATASAPRLHVYGATWCTDTGCGAHCDEIEPPTFALTTLGVDGEPVTMRVPVGRSCGMGFVDEEVEMFLQRWDG